MVGTYEITTVQGRSHDVYLECAEVFELLLDEGIIGDLIYFVFRHTLRCIERAASAVLFIVPLFVAVWGCLVLQ